MLFIYYISSILVTAANSPWVNENIPIRTDSYESFSNPKICMELSHYYPTGPAYLQTYFSYSLHSNLTTNLNEYVYYDFRRLDRKCKSFINFTMFGNDYQILNIRIVISLSESSSVAVFKYNFIKVFTPGIYKLIDEHQNFIIRVNVNTKSKNYLYFPVRVDMDYHLFLNYVPSINSDLCVVTYNNLAVVLEPDYGPNAPIGFIDSLETKIFRDGKDTVKSNYPAYACYKDKKYPDIPIIFIIEEENFRIELNVRYRYYAAGVEKFERKAFTLSDTNFGYVHNLKIIHKNCNKVFLIEKFTVPKFCKDGLKPLLYRSKHGKRYFAELYSNIKILHNVEFVGYIVVSTHDPCNEKYIKNK